MNVEQKTKAFFQRFNEWYQIEPRLKEYEDFAWTIIKEEGYPTEWEALCQALKPWPEIPEKVKIAHSMFYSADAVRGMIKNGKPEQAALEMMRLCNEGFRLNFVILAPVVAMGHNTSERQKKIRRKRLTWKGLTEAERKARDEKIRADFGKTRRTSPEGFANQPKNQDKYGLKASRIKQILKNTPGN